MPYVPNKDPKELALKLYCRLLKSDCEKNGYVLTGFPSTDEEARALQVIGVFPEIICKASAS